MLSDVCVCMLSKARAAEGAGARLRRGVLSSRSGEKLGLPDCVFPCQDPPAPSWSLGLAVFPKTRISLQAWPVDGLKMIPGFGNLIPAPCPILHDKTWIHLHFKAGLEGRFCKAEFAGRYSYPPDMLCWSVPWGSGVPRAGPHLPPTPTRREDVLVRTKTSDGGGGGTGHASHAADLCCPSCVHALHAQGERARHALGPLP